MTTDSSHNKGKLFRIINNIAEKIYTDNQGLAQICT